MSQKLHKKVDPQMFEEPIIEEYYPKDKYKKVDVPAGIAQTISDLEKTINEMSENFQDFDIDGECLEYFCRLQEVNFKNERIKRQILNLQEEKKLTQQLIDIFLEKEVEKAELRRIPASHVPIPEKYTARLAEIERQLAETKTIPEPVDPRPSLYELQEKHAKQKAMLQKLKKRLETAKTLALYDQWRPAYEQYAEEHKVPFDRTDERDIFYRCNTHHLETIIPDVDQRCAYFVNIGYEFPPGFIND
jgi:hypothetical protein